MWVLLPIGSGCLPLCKCTQSSMFLCSGPTMLVGSTIVPCHLILFMWLGPLSMWLLVYYAIGAGVMAYSTLWSGKAMMWLMLLGSLSTILECPHQSG